MKWDSTSVSKFDELKLRHVLFCGLLDWNIKRTSGGSLMEIVGEPLLLVITDGGTQAHMGPVSSNTLLQHQVVSLLAA